MLCVDCGLLPYRGNIDSCLLFAVCTKKQSYSYSDSSLQSLQSQSVINYNLFNFHQIKIIYDICDDYILLHIQICIPYT